MYTIATFTSQISDMGGNWCEPEIGYAVYGEFKNLPPLFLREGSARVWAKKKYGPSDVKNKKGPRWVVVKMSVMDG